MSLKSPFTTAIEKGGYSAIIYEEGNMHIAEDGRGKVIIENSDASTTIQKAIDDYAQNGLVLIMPDVTLTSTLKILKSFSRIKFIGGIVSTGVDAIQIGDVTNLAHTCNISVGDLDGGNKTAHGIIFSNTTGSVINFDRIHSVAIGLYFNPASGAQTNENAIRGGMLSAIGTAGVRFTSSSDTMEGNHIEAAIFNAPIGFDLISGGNSAFQTFVGVIDGATEAGSEDIKDAVGRQLFICDFVRRTTCTIAATTLLINVNGGPVENMLELRGGSADMLNIGFEPLLIWDFNRDSTGDWTAENCSMGTPTKSVTRITGSASDPKISRDIEVDGGQAQIIVIRYKYISGTATGGELYYSTSGHGMSGSYKKSFLIVDDGEWHVMVLDMSNLTAGGTDWIDNIITGIRYDYTHENSIMDIDFFAIGTRSYGTKYNLDDTLKTPASASAQGNKGDVRWDAGYIYLCTAADTWKRVAIATW